jgi:hypothetical protein
MTTAAHSDGEAAVGGEQRRRRRRRDLRAAPPGGPPPSDSGDGAEGDCDDIGDTFSGAASSDDGSSAAARPRRIIDRSASIVQQEEELSRELVVSVFGDCLDGSAGAISATIAGRFGLQASQFIVRPFGPASFLVILHDEAAATRVFDGGRPIIANSHCLHVRRWSRFISATAASLPVAVDVELRGIPAHAWGRATAEALLNDFCCIGDLHQVTADRRDVFRLAGWCSSLEFAPPVIDLEIIEAPVAGNGDIPAKRSLVYPVEVSLVRHDLPVPADHPSIISASSLRWVRVGASWLLGDTTWVQHSPPEWMLIAHRSSFSQLMREVNLGGSHVCMDHRATMRRSNS